MLVFGECLTDSRLVQSLKTRLFAIVFHFVCVETVPVELRMYKYSNDDGRSAYLRKAPVVEKQSHVTGLQCVVMWRRMMKWPSRWLTPLRPSERSTYIPSGRRLTSVVLPLYGRVATMWPWSVSMVMNDASSTLLFSGKQRVFPSHFSSPSGSFVAGAVFCTCFSCSGLLSLP